MAQYFGTLHTTCHNGFVSLKHCWTLRNSDRSGWAYTCGCVSMNVDHWEIVDMISILQVVVGDYEELRIPQEAHRVKHTTIKDLHCDN